jgi:hypothetical protein
VIAGHRLTQGSDKRANGLFPLPSFSEPSSIQMAQIFGPTNAEEVFALLLKELSSGDGPTASRPWIVQVRFERMSSSTLAQILSVMLGDAPLRFGISPSSEPAQSILFTDMPQPGDEERSRVVLVLEFRDQQVMELQSKAVKKLELDVMGSNGSRRYDIFILNPVTLKIPNSESINPNVSSQLTRPDIFPPTIPMWRVAFTSTAQFSASPLRSNEAMVGDMIERLKSVPSGQTPLILDGTANCGADSIGLVANSIKLRRPFRVVAVEMDELNEKALATNVELYGYQGSIESIQANTVEWLESKAGKASFDCMYFDPPWGGKDYKREASVRLELGGLNIWTLCRNIMEDRTRPQSNLRLIVVKGPYNLDKVDPALLALGNTVTFKTYPVARNIVYVYLDCSTYRSRVK